MAESKLDLRQLAIDRPAPRTSTTRNQRRRWVTRYAIPACVLLGFTGLFGIAAGHQFTSARDVTVVPVIVKRGVSQQAGVSLFQAAGWIEPRPNATSIAALAAGVIEELLVVEGQDVRKGELIARLISVDAEIAVEQSKATLLKSEGDKKQAEAELTAATSRRDNPLHLRLPLAEARGLLANAITEREKLPFLTQAAETELQVQQRNYQGKLKAGDAVPGTIVRRAQGDVAAAQAELNELKSRGPNLQREIEAFEEKVRVLEEQLKLQIDDHGRVAEAQAKLLAATAVCNQAKLQVQRAQLDLERMQVVAPMNGRILRVIATPGTRVMGQKFAGQSSSTVVEMYDPAHLQIRADVRLEDVPLVTPGAPVEIKTASSDRTLEAVVLHPTSTADIQKNTLEVKVALIDPPDTIRPDMLVTATFLAPATKADSIAEQETARVLVPDQLVLQPTGTSGASVWIVDANNRAELRAIQVGGIQTGGLIEITSGLEVTDKLIASGFEGLSTGDRVVVIGDDSTIGVRR